MKKILVTGGSGYIGSHTVVELIQGGYRPTILDNLSNSKASSIERIEKIAGRRPEFVELDLLDEKGLKNLFSEKSFDAVIHFAGLKAVGESVREPMRYYRNNISGTLNLCRMMDQAGCRRMVFSSSATVYGEPKSLPIRENFPTSATNPYGRTKLMLEEILTDLHVGDSRWDVMLLRYFNPVGAHPSGEIGEDPNGIPNNLMPFIAQVAVGRLPELKIFGGDYPTPDGTGVRDYIHVVDLAKGHVKALMAMDSHPGIQKYNLGTGRGFSVLEMVNAFGKERGEPIPYQIVERRPGDVAACYADPTSAKKELGWKAELGIEAMCADTWRWQSKNPNGLPG